MKKTNLTKIMFALLAGLLIVGFTACEDNGTTADDLVTEQFGTSLDADEYNPPDMAEEVADFSGGNLAEEFSLPEGDNYSAQMLRKRDGERTRERERKDGMKLLMLGKILRDMQVTEEQLTVIKTYLVDFYKCRQALYEESLPERREIMANANVARKEILGQLKAGEIDRAAAEAALKLLAESTRASLQELFDQEAYCECLNLLLGSVRDVLTEEQLPLWDEWYAGLEGPCFTE